MGPSGLILRALVVVPFVPALFMATHATFLNTAFRVPLYYVIMLSITGFVLTVKLIPHMTPLAKRAGLTGKDMAKIDSEDIPEAMGVVPATIFLICIIFFQLLQFMPTEYNAATTSICFMIFLGFADDVLDLRWRYKLILPTIATLPLLVAYEGSTTIMLPRVWPLLQYFGPSLDLGYIYLAYMLVLAVFCTNSINIHAGINGLEAGQSFVIAYAVMMHNLIELAKVAWDTLPPGTVVEEHQHAHLFSLFLVIPFIATTLGLLWFNWYPSQVFVGDTFTYFAGMTFAVLGILGHFSKTLMTFFIPQILNFAMSLPQLFRIWPCPRHRLPRLNKDTGLLEPVRGHWTLINLVLFISGPMSEQNVTIALLVLQAICCTLGFWIRYVGALYFYSAT